MNTRELKKLVTETMSGMQQHAEELRELDAALGDGDLGVTVSSGAKAVISALNDVSDDATPADVAKSCARAFASANPSTMAALVAGALLAGAKVWDRGAVSYQDALVFADAAPPALARGASPKWATRRSSTPWCPRSRRSSAPAAQTTGFPQRLRRRTVGWR